MRDRLTGGACLLVLDAALSRVSAAVVSDGEVLAQRAVTDPRGASQLPGFAAEVLAQAGVLAERLDAVAATVGPGSFTGLRAALSLANGLALAAQRPALGVSVAEALRAVCELPPGWTCWIAIDSRRGRVFLDTGDGAQAVALDALPMPHAPVGVAGDAAIAVASRLAARGARVRLLEARLPEPGCVAGVAARRLHGLLPPLPAQPLYVDPPEARLPAGGLRPAPEAEAMPAGPAMSLLR